jgi:peptide/nickel transport system substrate-binding protein
MTPYGDGDQADAELSQRLSQRVITRRGMLRAGAIGGAMALAGCSGGASDSGEGSTGDDFEPVDNSFVTGTNDNPTNWQYNVYNFTQPGLHPMQNDMFQRYHISRGEYSPYALSIEKYQDTTAVLKVRDGLTWHNGDPGDPVTNDDLYTKLVLDAIVGDTISTLWTDIKKKGDRAVELTLDGTIGKPLFHDALNYYWLETPYRKYKKYVERWEDATTDKARKTLATDLRNAAFDKPHGNGPFQFEKMSSRRYRMSRYDHHPDADKINWDYWDIERVSTNWTSVLLGGQVDAKRNFTAPESLFKTKPDWLQPAFLPALWGHSLAFNNDHKDFGNIRVRQAICEFIDRGACAKNYGRFGQPVQAPSGLVGNINSQNEPSNRWKGKVSKQGAKQLHRYDNPKRGRRLLREEGYKKVNGQWQRPDGSPLKMPIKVPSYDDWQPVYETIASNLREEGIDSKMITIEPTAYWSKHYLAGDFVAASTGWTLQRTTPYYVFDMYYNIDAEFMSVKPSKIEVPPVGKPDGKLQSVNIQKLMNELHVSSGDRTIELRDKLAWITNQTVPLLQIQEINDPVWFTTDDWNVPAPDDPVYQSKWPLWWFPRMGKLQAEGK